MQDANENGSPTHPAEPDPKWQRHHFEPGGGNALVFYAVYGDLDFSEPLSRSVYRAAGVPTGIDLSVYDNAIPNQAEAMDQLRDRGGYLWEQFEAASPAAAQAALAAPRMGLLRGEAEDPSSLEYLRDCVGIVTWMLDRGGVAVYDPQMFQWWTADAWRDQIFEPDAPAPRRHVVILTSEDDDPTRLWFHTRGMRKFGRPDISVRNVGPDFRKPIADLCNRFIETMAMGAVVPDGRAIEMDSLPEGGVVRHGGDLDDPDFNNVHIEIAWPDDALI